ncbi:terminal nucleotidyltransferase 2 [Homo sapiens]|uniref:polynucleotide adenylyltransferase n=2 Tax=Homininae TaxID=207598 RepID=D6RAF2_HUMAN|nr:poly(A) RNA polymerase GLD2 isoform 3 [Homo sapiens]NP_001375062.1 poly(A) RNA polymerase GLD2 isoform 3 [Homo sapiens]XP_047272812.1 poly(A) RNA polymerase GLD2 isoform X6 [Homo sapiens]XP_047272813.1 poly(A) RNA polymerase GLD2 isoform X6 [Homo sapiens]XP_047272814.1 poly(A) RNA polymerase GLD2 isoform X6 [Homo sapiens]XP_054207873.1 poly(A) RNA polymerase GLD2 isoform X6 [Homo sapiens]XP_054207874.1 poly(A) RNA polymerase GLD2 isoform X6 [Homo sapiens]XP_054207875.1 poly(A) RNA polymer|eukprot:NP_001284674.1 poly(A) RNA polymerase GLD2 isoform 3 [Homo sapiens]
MFPNSILGRPPFTPNHQQHNNFFTLSPTVYSHQQLIDAQFNFQNADLSRAVSLQQLTYGNVSPIQTSASPLFRGRKRLSDEKNLPLDGKRQRFHSPHQEPTVVNQIVPLSGERRYSMPPLFHTHYVPDIVRCVPPFREIAFLEPREITLPEAKDKLSQQILELFETCQQQISDLKKKELCRTQLQREIQLLFPQSRLFLVGSSLNGFGTRSSDGDLCLVVKEEPCFFQVNQKTEARHILTLVHKHFCTRLSGYIERPQLIRAKVPIVKFRDKVSCVEFDLNVNNIVGIRNTFLLRTYAYPLPEPILPSLQKIYPESFSPAIQLHLVHQAPCNVPPYLSKNESNLGDLLLGFLKYYATEFDWNSQMISVREAKAIPRPDGIEWRNKYICVEEPFDGTNTARAVHEKQKFDMIKDQFLKSWHRLKNKRDLNSILPVRAAVLKR